MKNIVFDCERMKYAHTGLYHFCLHLGNTLLQNIDTAKEHISFYIPEKVGKVFGENRNYLKQKSFHKFIFPSTSSFDLWHCTYQNSNYKPDTKKLKQVFTIHDLNFLYDDAIDRNKRKKILKHIQNHINSSDKICAVSNYVKKDAEQHLQLNNKAIEVIYNGCNINIHKNLSQPAVQIHQPFLFTIGTITEKKNFHVLPALLRDNDFLLIIAGIVQSHEYLKRIIQYAKAFGVEDRVVFINSVSENDKQWYMKYCEAFLFPSLTEGFGLPVIEAMAYGKPVFLSKATSLPEIGGSVAYYFNSFDAEDMQQTFQKGIEHYKMHNPAKDIIKRSEEFSWNKAAKKYLDVYRSLYS